MRCRGSEASHGGPFPDLPSEQTPHHLRHGAWVRLVERFRNSAQPQGFRVSADVVAPAGMEIPDLSSRIQPMLHEAGHIADTFVESLDASASGAARALRHGIESVRLPRRRRRRPPVGAAILLVIVVAALVARRRARQASNAAATAAAVPTAFAPSAPMTTSHA